MRGFQLLIFAFCLVGALANCQLDDPTACRGHGDCAMIIDDQGNQTYCECHDFFTGKECQIEQKSQKTALLYSIFTGWLGVDRFYLGDVGTGIGKLILGLSSCIVFCGITKGFLCQKKPDEEMVEWEDKRMDLAMGGFGGVFVFFGILLIFGLIAGMFVFWVHDVIKIALGKMEDSKGNPLFYDL